MINNEELNLQSQYYRQVKLSLKLIQGPDSLMEKPQIQNLINNGIDIDSNGIIQEGEQYGSGNGIVTMNRQKFISNNHIILDHSIVSRSQTEIVYNPFTGFNLICTSKSNLSRIFLRDGDDQYQYLQNQQVIVLYDIYEISVYLSDNNEQQNRNQQDNTAYNYFIPQILHQAKKQIIETLMQKQQNNIQNKQNKPYLRLEFYCDSDDLDKNLAQETLKIDNPEFILLKEHIKDERFQDKILKFIYDQEQKQWKVKLMQQDNGYNHGIYLKNNDQIDDEENSNQYPLQNEDLFGLSNGEEKPIVFQCIIKSQGKKLECQSCNEEFDLNDDLQYYNIFKCDHFICSDCQLQFLQFKIQTGQIDYNQYSCLGAECNEKIKINQEFKNLAPEIYDAITKGINRIYSIECPNQNCKKPVMNYTREGQLNCDKCGTKICAVCNKFSHEGICKKVIVDGLRKLKGLDEIIRFCPKCYNFYAKDDQCDHVICRQCQTEFCFRCSAFREPTMAHGNHYHREGCTFYSEYNVPEYLPDKCSHCKFQKKACEKPQSYQFFLEDLKKKINCGDETLKVVRKRF